MPQTIDLNALIGDELTELACQLDELIEDGMGHLDPHSVMADLVNSRVYRMRNALQAIQAKSA